MPLHCCSDCLQSDRFQQVSTSSCLPSKAIVSSSVSQDSVHGLVFHKIPSLMNFLNFCFYLIPSLLHVQCVCMPTIFPFLIELIPPILFTKFNEMLTCHHPSLLQVMYTFNARK